MAVLTVDGRDLFTINGNGSLVATVYWVVSERQYDGLSTAVHLIGRSSDELSRHDIFIPASAVVEARYTERDHEVAMGDDEGQARLRDILEKNGEIKLELGRYEEESVGIAKGQEDLAIY